MHHILFAAAVLLDPQTGLWFPPYANRTAYLNRDPAHSLMADVNRAFKESPALGDEVCAAFLAAPEPKTPESNDPSVKQFRTMFAMQCVARGAHARRRTEDAEKMTGALATLQAMFDEEERGISRRAPDELIAAIDNGYGPALRPALRAVAMTPSYTFAIHTLLALPLHRLSDGQKGVSHAQVAAFLEQLYRTRAAAGNADAWQWKAGLPAILLFNGKLDDARKAAEDWYAEAPRERASFARVMLAVIDRALGREGALDKVAAGCVPSAAFREQQPASNPAEYCRQAAAMLVINALDVQQEKAAPGLAAAAFDLERTRAYDWPYRLSLIGNASLADPRGAQKVFNNMLADPDIPEGAQLDAMHYLAKIASQHDRPRVAPLVDCWIQMQGIEVAAATPEMWKRLATTPISSQPGRPFAQCGSCVMRALSMRMDAAIAMQQWNLARQTLEKILSLTVSYGGSPTVVRTELYDFAQSEIRNGRRADAVQILSYLKGQPEDNYVSSGLAKSAESIPAGALQPWQSPVPVDAALLAAACPPKQ